MGGLSQALGSCDGILGVAFAFAPACSLRSVIGNALHTRTRTHAQHVRTSCMTLLAVQCATVLQQCTRHGAVLWALLHVLRRLICIAVCRMHANTARTSVGPDGCHVHGGLAGAHVAMDLPLSWRSAHACAKRPCQSLFCRHAAYCVGAASCLGAGVLSMSVLAPFSIA
jgi:hypothetical protein